MKILVSDMNVSMIEKLKQWQWNERLEEKKIYDFLFNCEVIGTDLKLIGLLLLQFGPGPGPQNGLTGR